MKFATIYRSYQFKNARPFNGVVSKYYWVLFFFEVEREPLPFPLIETIVVHYKI